MTNSPNQAQWMTQANRTLMELIRAKFANELAAAVFHSSLPASFLAALVANETGGDPARKRFEKGVLSQLWEVLIGRQAHFGGILRVDLIHYVSGFASTPVTAPTTLPANAFQKVDELATSWGLTQIMGYHIVEWMSLPGWYRTVDDLVKPDANLRCAAFLLSTFANHFTLNLAKDFEKLLRCWNTGKPDGETFDPEYVPKGLARMELYRSTQSGD